MPHVPAAGRLHAHSTWLTCCAHVCTNGKSAMDQCKTQAFVTPQATRQGNRRADPLSSISCPPYTRITCMTAGQRQLPHPSFVLLWKFVGHAAGLHITPHPTQPGCYMTLMTQTIANPPLFHPQSSARESQAAIGAHGMPCASLTPSLSMRTPIAPALLAARCASGSARTGGWPISKRRRPAPSSMR